MQSNQSKLIHDTVGYYSSKAKITLVEGNVDRHLLSFALSEFLQRSLASSSAARPVVRVKDTFILGVYFKSTEVGARDPAFSVQVATNTEHVNRILVDVRVSPQSVAFRSLHLSSKYSVEEDEEPLRCVVLPSLKNALVKAYHERPPPESALTNWTDFVDFYDRQYGLHLPDETEERGYATIVINNSPDPNRFSSATEDVVPVAMLWTESGLSRRDLHGDSGELLSRYIVSTIASLESASVKSTQISMNNGVAEEKRLAFIPVLQEAFPDVNTVKIDEIIEKRKESRTKGPGFVKSSKRASQQSEETNSSLDLSITSTETSSQQSQQTCPAAPLSLSQTVTDDVFDFDAVIHPTTLDSVLESLHSPSSATQSTSSGNAQTPVKFRAGVRLGARLTPGRTTQALASAPFTPLASSRARTPEKKENAPDAKQEESSKAQLPQSNPKKRKISTLNQSPSKAFQPPRPKIAKS